MYLIPFTKELIGKGRKKFQTEKKSAKFFLKKNQKKSETSRNNLTHKLICTIQNLKTKYLRLVYRPHFLTS